MRESELAFQISSNFPESLLWDFEAGDDTDIDGWSIQDFKKYCEILEVDPAAALTADQENDSIFNFCTATIRRSICVSQGRFPVRSRRALNVRRGKNIT